MESAYNFIKITLLGLILGVMIVFLFQANNWAEDIKKTVRQPVVYPDREYRHIPLEKYKNEPPICTLPNTPKHKI